MRRAEIGDEQGRLGERRELLQALHQPGAREERRGARVAFGCVPVEEAVLRLRGAQALEKRGGGGDESRVLRFAFLGFAKAGRDGIVDLLRQIQILPGERGEKGVEEVKPAQLRGARHFLALGVTSRASGARLLISLTNSDTSRNSL